MAKFFKNYVILSFIALALYQVRGQDEDLDELEDMMVTTAFPPLPDLPTTPPTGNWTSGCVGASMGVRLNFTFDNAQGQAKAAYDIPVHAVATGECNGDNARMTLTFDVSGDETPWKATLNFKKSETQYQFETLVVNFTTASELLFPGAKDNKLNVSATGTVNSPMVSEGNSFKCESGIDVIDITPKDAPTVSNILFANLQVEAFTHQNTTSPVFGNTEPCAADAGVSNIVPIAVGAALAVLVVIVLVAYLIGRKRNRPGYETV